MTRFVWRNGAFRDPRTNEPMPIPERDGVCAPRVQSDIPEYRSPVDGKPITSRTHRREDLKRADCVEAEPFKRMHREEYRERKAKEAKVLEQRKKGRAA